MSILKLATSKRWLGWLSFVIVFALACVGLAQWQWARRLEAVAEIRTVAANWDAAPATLDDVVPRGGALQPEREWTPIALEGEYLLDEQLLVRNRPLSGRPGFDVLVPLLLDEGRVVIVDRGWLPTGETQDSPDVVPSAPSGPVEVIVRLKPSEPEIAGRGAPAGQIATIHLPELAERLEGAVEGIDTGAVVTGAYGLLDRETPAPAERPVAATRPVADEGPHLSYTFQWYLFGLLGFVGYGWALRNEHRGLRATDEGGGEPPAPKQRRSGPSDADVEDEILDRQASEINSA